MVKFIMQTARGKIVGLGLVERNLELLKRGQPMSIRLAELAVVGLEPGTDISTVEVVIFYGRTEDDIQTQLVDFIGPTTKVIEKRGN